MGSNLELNLPSTTVTLANGLSSAEAAQAQTMIKAGGPDRNQDSREIMLELQSTRPVPSCSGLHVLGPHRERCHTAGRVTIVTDWKQK